MLSRVANSIYWMSRYIERAENVARFISVNLNLQLDISNEQSRHWEPLIMTSGDHEEFKKRYDTYDQRNVIQFLTFDKEYSSSILSCLFYARENARSIREIISSEMWEHLNNFYLELKESGGTDFVVTDPHRFYKIIQMRSLMFNGLRNGTMSHGEGWSFANAGSLIERADKTSRILDVKYFMLLPNIDLINTPIDNIQWTAVLKSASAFEMYRKQFHLITPKRVAEFLIFDGDFPRAIRHCVARAKQYINQVSGIPNGNGRNAAIKQLGKLEADLEYTDIDEVVEGGLHEFLDSIQQRLNKVDSAIGTTFFNIKPSANTATNEQ